MSFTYYPWLVSQIPFTLNAIKLIIGLPYTRCGALVISGARTLLDPEAFMVYINSGMTRSQGNILGFLSFLSFFGIRVYD